MIAIVRNDRFQLLTDLSLSVVGTLQVGTRPWDVLGESASFGSLDPLKAVRHRFDVTCAVQGTLEVTAVARFRFEDAPQSIAARQRITIMPTLHVFCAERPLVHDFLQVSVQNLFQQRMTDVRVRTPDGGGALIAASLERQEKASAFFRAARAAADSNVLEFSWSLPFALRCVQPVRLNDRAAQPQQSPIVLTLGRVPQTSPALQQIDLVAKIRNTTDETLEGEIVIARDNQGLLAVGKPHLRFAGLRPSEEREVPLSFVSLYPGCFQFPAFTFEIAGGRSFVHESGAGLIVIGYAQ
jgi:hypothetical protein